MSTEKIGRNRLYSDLAYLWPLISRPEDYAKEAGFWRDILRKKFGPGQHEILELGVGGGHNLSHLAKDFQATAVDLSEEMLANSLRLNPDVEHLVGDTRSVRLGRKFRAVFIHDAISYMLSENDLRAAFNTAAAHLEPGGVFVTAPDYFRETFADGEVTHSRQSDGTIEVTHIEFQYDPDPHDTTVETLMFFLIREKGKLRIEQDLHLTGLFPMQTWVDLMAEAGFTVEKHDYPVHDNERPAYLLVGALGS